MKHIITVNQRIKQWQILLDEAHSKDLSMKEQTDPAFGDHHHDEDDDDDGADHDPFDCSDLIIPETKELVQKVLKRHIQDWRDLDSRIVLEQEGCDDGDGNHFIGGKKRQREDQESTSDNGHGESNQDGDFFSSSCHWKNSNHANRVRLPDFFDYETKGPCPCPLTAPRRRGQKRRQVVSLEDPSKHLDYEVELWKIFQKVPLEKEIEDDAVQGSICTHLLELKEEIDQGYREYSRLDGHALSRLRKKDLHHWPRLRRTTRHKGKKNDSVEDRLDEIDCATVKFEFWRRQVKRFGSDPNKCEMEFLSTQTLLDVHKAIVDCTQDELFDKGLASTNQQVLSGDNSNDGQVEDDLATLSSGFFFIEGIFYSIGDVDYVTPVTSWLNDHLERPNKSNRKTVNRNKGNDRKSFLNIHSGENTTLDQKKMDQVTLGDIPMRLGMRYVHICHGDVETSVFVSDITMRMKDEITKRSQYPLLHDIWTTSTSSLVHGVGVCEGCHHCPAVVLTIEDELADGGPTPFCRTCYEKLHYSHEKDEQEITDTTSVAATAAAATTLRYNNFKVVPMSVLQNFIDLSVGHDSENAMF
jgi:hypothetical protein